jgi:HlyD family secretion protein
VWVVGPNGKPTAITLGLGITDGTYTEVAKGELQEGQAVIVGLVTAGDRPQTGAAPRVRF